MVKRTDPRLAIEVTIEDRTTVLVPGDAIEITDQDGVVRLLHYGLSDEEQETEAQRKETFRAE